MNYRRFIHLLFSLRCKTAQITGYLLAYNVFDGVWYSVNDYVHHWLPHISKEYTTFAIRNLALHSFPLYGSIETTVKGTSSKQSSSTS